MREASFSTLIEKSVETIVPITEIYIIYFTKVKVLKYLLKNYFVGSQGGNN